MRKKKRWPVAGSILADSRDAADWQPAKVGPGLAAWEEVGMTAATQPKAGLEQHRRLEVAAQGANQYSLLGWCKVGLYFLLGSTRLLFSFYD
jgi:hypothetical protein